MCIMLVHEPVTSRDGKDYKYRLLLHVETHPTSRSPVNFRNTSLILTHPRSPYGNSWTLPSTSSLDPILPQGSARVSAFRCFLSGSRVTSGTL